MTSATEKQEFSFQTEIKQLLHILSHSLYQNREICIRELVSNASDALDKLRYVQLTDESQRDETPLEISLEPNAEDKILTIRDTGIGLTHEELISNLGTIAHSGSLEFLNKLTGNAKADLSLIGQFGVGFYSAFMLADRVEVLTRSYSEDKSWRWESDGSGNFTIEPTEDLPRGTQVRLHLKDDLQEFTQPERLKHIIRKYSTFVPHPIKIEDEQINEQRPIWVEPKSQLTEDDYARFYQHLSHRAEEKPLWHLHISSDSPIQFHTILYCPPTNFELMGFGRVEHGLHLCAKRILVQDDCRDLLPEYLRFIYGLVDSEDLPLNVSRETLQDNTIFRKIRKVLVKRILDNLAHIAQETPEDYLSFYRQFGAILREGISADYDNREKISQLLRFQSSHAGETGGLTSLSEYVERADDSQKQIYFVTGPDVATIERNPNLEIFRRKKLEVFYLDDPIDEFVLSNLQSFSEKQLTSIDAADVEFPGAADETKDETSEDAKQDEESASNAPGFDRVLELFRESLGDEVSEVRESKRLTDSPCCLVNPKGSMSTQLQKVIQMSNKDFEMAKRIFEINPSAPLIRRLSQLSSNADQSDFIKECGRQLYSNAMLQEGLAPDPQDVVTRVQHFMEELAEKRSPIIT